MRKPFLSFITIIIFFSVNAQPPTDKRLAGLDTFVLKVLKDWHAAGVSIAVVEKGKVVYTGGFGYRDLDKKLQVTENTLFGIGSCTKAFTASILGMLVKEGKVDLDKPVRNYLPELKFQNEYTNDHCTLRDMMCHRTGLPRHDLSWYGSWGSRQEFLERIQYMEPTAELRAKWQYNNFMFMAQGMVVEKLTNKSWEENMKERIFKPLGMDNTNLSTIDMENSPDHSLAFVSNDSSISTVPFRNIDAMGPAGSVNSCSKDMAKWLITWINDGKYNGKEIIPSPYRNDAITIQMAMGGGTPSAEMPDVHVSGYGLGWMMSSYRGHYRVEHGGNIDGFSASTCFFPTDSIGVIVLTNQNGSSVTAIVRNTIADRILKVKPIDWLADRNAADAKAKAAAKEAEGKDISNKKPGTNLSHTLKEYEGLYSHPGYGTAEVVMQNDSLFMFTPGNKIWLRHYHYDVFETFGVDKKDGIDSSQKSELKIRFDMNEAGEINSVWMELQPGLKALEFTRKPKPKEITKDELKKYEGNYELTPTVDAKFYIKGEKTLYAFIEGQPEYELVATDKNKFVLKAMSGYSIQFEENEKGEIISCSFIQPNGTFKAKKK